MPKRSSKLDLNETAFSTLQQVTGEAATPISQTLSNADIRRQIMQEMGRRGGLKGGKARAEALKPSKRKEIARAAAVKRWSAVKRKLKK